MPQKSLLSYEEVLEQTKKNTRHLLLGNGFSMAYDYDRFSFTSLLDSAKKNKIIQEGSAIDKLFSSFATSDFEQIIKQLESSSKVFSLYDEINQDITKKLVTDAKSLKKYLVEIVTNNHPEKSTDIPDEEYNSCIEFIKDFDSIYTLNYDLLLFWTIMKYRDKGSQGKLDVNDGFTLSDDNPDELVYKNDNSEKQTIHYLHGALHLFDKQHEIIKISYSRTQVPLKEQTLQNLNNSIYPIFISEGTAKKKQAKIIHNPYLNNSYSRFRNLNNGVLVIFGVSLKSNDEHIQNAIIKNSVKNIYVGVSSIDKISEFDYLKEELSAHRNLYFYDYKTVKVWR